MSRRFLRISLDAPVLAIAICDRCRMKRPWTKLRQDIDKPGLRVCSDKPMCLDQLDPRKVVSRSIDRPSLPWARPDQLEAFFNPALARSPYESIFAENGDPLLTEGDDPLQIETPDAPSSGDAIVYPALTLTAESGEPLLTESGDIIEV